MNTLGGRLRWLREKRRLTQKELATKIGVTEATMSRYEANKHIPGADTIVILSNVLRVTSSADVTSGPSSTGA